MNDEPLIEGPILTASDIEKRWEERRANPTPAEIELVKALQRRADVLIKPLVERTLSIIEKHYGDIE